MIKYTTLVNILDQLRKEAPQEFKKYHPLEDDLEKISQARSRAFIHLFLKVKFGLLTFAEREDFITDDTNDGGVDGYFIDRDQKTIYFLQTKFRTTKDNFENKEIQFEEILNMDVDRIVDGETKYENGQQYNSKILKMLERIKGIDDIGRWKYQVVILANIKEVQKSKLQKLSGGFPCEIYNHERCYTELVFPVVCGTYYNAPNLFIYINLSNKSAGAKISYTVDTELKECSITVVFVPTLEIAKIMHKYKNAILKYNPRSYLDLTNNPVNLQITGTIVTKKTNEFALFNNGITMLSDNTSFSEQIGQKEKAQLVITNPQIINGGQTAYTLGHIFDMREAINRDLKFDKPEDMFSNKEVLLKVITFNESSQKDDDKKLELIEAISKATNQQTAVTEADRRSNDKIQIDIQNAIYKEFGLFYERKRGEFGDGVRNKYIDRSKIIDRESFLRICYACDGWASQARKNSEKVIFSEKNFMNILNNVQRYREYIFAYKCYEQTNRIQKKFEDDVNNKFGVVNYGNALRYGKFAVVAVTVKKFDSAMQLDMFDAKAEAEVSETLSKWLLFEEHIANQAHNKAYFRRYTEPESGEQRLELNFDGYYKGTTLNNDIKKYFSL